VRDQRVKDHVFLAKHKKRLICVIKKVS